MLTLIIILLTAAVTGYVLANKPEPDQCMPYIEPDRYITTHEWARDQALAFLKLAPLWGWVETDVTPTGLLGTSVYLFESGDLSLTVSHNLNPSADFFVDVRYMDQNWSLRVSQTGECTLVN